MTGRGSGRFLIPVQPIHDSSTMAMSDASQTLFADDGGTGGLPVVFLHSLGGNASQWAAQLAHLRPHRRAVALEWRGHGRTGAPADGDHSIPAAAADVAATTDRLGLERFVLVGHSAGAAVALACVGRHPERVAGLLLVDPSGDARMVPAEQAEAFLGALESDAYPGVIEEYWRSIMADSEPAVQERLLADLRATPKETVVGTFRAFMDFDPVEPLRRYAGPVLSVVTPLNDDPSSLHRLHPALPHVGVTGRGHWLHVDRPEDLNRILDGFLARVENG